MTKEEAESLIIENNTFVIKNKNKNKNKNKKNKNKNKNNSGKNNKNVSIKVNKQETITVCYLDEIFEKEIYIRHFLAFSSESLATENILGKVLFFLFFF